LAQEPIIRNYTTLNDLSSNECYRVVQDHKGYLWIASNEGLDCFNGQTFLHYTQKDGLPDNVIINLVLDEEGCLWMSGMNSQIAYWKDGSFYYPEELNKFLKANIGRGLITSIGRDGDKLQLGFDEQYSKSITYSISKRTIIEKPAPPRSLTIYSSKYGSTYNYCFTSNSTFPFELIIRYGQNNEFRTPVPFILPRGNAISLGNDSVLVSAGEYIYLLHNGKLDYFYKAKSVILWLYLDSRKNIWAVVYNNGVLLINSGKLKEKEIKHLYTDCSFSSVVEDREHSIWLSSLNQGIYQIPNPSIAIYTNKRTTLNLTTVVEYDNKILASGSDNNIYTVSDSGLIPFLSFANSALTKVNDMQVIHNALFVCANPSFIIRKDKGKKYSSSPLIYKKQNIFLSYIIRNVTDSMLFYFGNRKWFAAYNFKTGDVGKPTKIPSNIYSIYSDAPNQIYIGSAAGLYKLVNDSVTFLSKNVSLLNTRINHINKKQGVYIFSTQEKGLVFWNEKKYWSINEKDGLPSNTCFKTIVDKQGNLWALSQKGLTKITGDYFKGYRLNTLTQKQDILSEEIDDFTIIHDTILATTPTGLVAIPTDSLLEPKIPPVFISKISIDDSVYKKEPILHLSYAHNYIKISIDVLSYKMNSDFICQYRLVGLDSNWKNIQQTPLEFSRLSPGEYKLEVRVKGRTNDTTVNEDSVTLQVTSPWFKSWWFYTLSIALLIGLIYILIFIRFKLIAKRAKEKHRLEIQITESEMRTLRAQANPHFIFNALNSIRFFILKNEMNQAGFYLQRFASLMRGVLENSKKELVSLQSDIDHLQTYIELERIRMRNVFSYTIDYSEELKASKILVPPMLLQPIVENSIWHGLATLKDRPGKIEICVSKRELGVLITILDNGIGRKKSAEIKAGKMQLKKSFGISIVKDRIHLFNQQHKMKITMEIIDLVDNVNQPIGTKVEITLK